MVVPVGDQAREQLGPAQERRIRGRGAAEREVVAAAGARVLAVEHELLGAQAALARLGIEERGVLDELVPAAGGMNIDLEHARVGVMRSDCKRGSFGGS